ncbi:MAG: hypothetical protein OIN66_14755 [Candidatus Methanoperedens sp.]|nr:hypothetical protein [Candidatus Methanoperedens sp.]
MIQYFKKGGAPATGAVLYTNKYESYPPQSAQGPQRYGCFAVYRFMAVGLRAWRRGRA